MEGMPPVRGRYLNTVDIADVSDAITISNLVSTKIADANEDRLFFHVNNNDAVNAVWIKLQPADEDDDVKGIYLPRKGGIGWEMPTDSLYTGEISAISDNGTPDIYVTEYSCL